MKDLILLEKSEIPSAADSSPPKTLLDCPVEILQSIFESLSCNDIYSICLSCKELNTVAEPSLYAKIHWKWEMKNWTLIVPPIVPLLRSISDKPRLATYIKELRLDGETLHHTQQNLRPPQIPVSESQIQKLASMIQQTNFPYASYWIYELYDGTMDAFVALLLSQLSNLTQLRLGANYINHGHLVGMILRATLCESSETNPRMSRFESIQNVTFEMVENSAGYKHSRNTQDSLSLFYLPKVRHISAAIQNPVRFAWPGSSIPCLSTLTSLYLLFIREGHLSQILSTTPALKILHWQWYYYSVFKDQFVNPIIDLDQIVKAIVPVRNTLTELKLSAYQYTVDIVPDPLETRGSLNAMSKFMNLKTFEAPMSFLLGCLPSEASEEMINRSTPSSRIPKLESVIPPNIEYLSINEDLADQVEYYTHEFTLLGAVQLWLENWESTTPHLCGISLILDYLSEDNYNDWGPKTQEGFRAVCEGANVPLDIIDMSERGRSSLWHSFE